jgi:hypothetical protein
MTHLHYTLFPASDHFLFANLEPKRLVPVARGVELTSICEGTLSGRQGKGLDQES